MKFFLFVTLILNISLFSFASESAGWFKNPAHPGKCVVDGLVLSPGEEAKTPGDCGRILCGNDSFATLQYCGAMSVEDCELTDYININAPYPECCEKKVVCKSN